MKYRILLIFALLSLSLQLAAEIAMRDDLRIDSDRFGDRSGRTATGIASD